MLCRSLDISKAHLPAGRSHENIRKAQGQSSTKTGKENGWAGLG